jgi:hypothetical protein
MRVMHRVRLAKRSFIDLARDLPPIVSVRWTAREKAAVAIAVRRGTIRRREARERYLLSAEELDRWEHAFAQDGVAGLQAKNLQRVPAKAG